MLKELIRIANELDKKGLVKEADYLDRIIKRSADNDLDPDMAGDFRWDETPLNLNDAERDPRDTEYHTNVSAMDHAAGGGGLDDYSGRSKDIKLVTDWIQTFPTAYKNIKKISLDNFNGVRNSADPTGKEDVISLILRYLPDHIGEGSVYTAIERIENRESRSEYDDGSDEIPDGWIDPITPNYEPTRKDIDWTNRKQEDTRPAMWFETDDDE